MNASGLRHLLVGWTEDGLKAGESPERRIEHTSTGGLCVHRGRGLGKRDEPVYETAIACGGRGDGEPGERQAVVTTYFGAFIRDLDGNKIEALTFRRMATL